MKLFGYKKHWSEGKRLKKITIECSMNEIGEIILFLHTVKKEHSKETMSRGVCHTHFQDWSKNWDRKSSDLIIETPANFKSQIIR